ncbi:MAG: hypothetical protein ACTSP3_14985 [Candidatus Heimdallarchaeaceae archaeon]
MTSPLQERVLGQLNWKNEVLEIKRSFRSSRGYHFGIQEEIQQGDSSIVYVEEGAWTVHIKFFRQEQSLGEIVKIVTPLELANAGRIKYINLGLMLIKRGESVKVVDEGLITSLAEKDVYSCRKSQEKTRKRRRADSFGFQLILGDSFEGTYSSFEMGSSFSSLCLFFVKRYGFQPVKCL